MIRKVVNTANMRTRLRVSESLQLPRIAQNHAPTHFFQKWQRRCTAYIAAQPAILLPGPSYVKYAREVQTVDLPQVPVATIFTPFGAVRKQRCIHLHGNLVLPRLLHVRQSSRLRRLDHHISVSEIGEIVAPRTYRILYF